MPSEQLTPPGFAQALGSKFPALGTTIFTVMSAYAAEHRAVNLGQGFPDFECDPKIVDAVTEAMQQGMNQYPPMAGVVCLREGVASKIEALHGHRYDAQNEITITAGATQGIMTSVLAVVRAGDEVIVLEPCYDSYVPNIELAGARAVRVPLTPRSFRPDFDAIAGALGARTRAIIINTPHNPSATVWSAQDMHTLEELLAPTNVIVISDEVYEHMVYAPHQHQSVSKFPALAARAFVHSSFGKTFHVTGWKVGAVAAPAALSAEFRKVHQYNVFTVNTPAQYGLAKYLQDPKPYIDLPAFYQRKRDLFRAGLRTTRFGLLPADGSYFQCVDFSAIADMPDDQFCIWLTKEIGVAAIPLSAFYGNGFDQRVIRFCFAKKDQTLQEALARLAKL